MTINTSTQPLPASDATAVPATPPSAVTAPAILFYDGDCGFCSKSVQFILKHEGPRRPPPSLRFATLQGPTGTALRARHPELAGVDSMIWFQPADASQPERLLIRSSAALAAMTYLGGIWHLLAIPARLIPRPFRDAIYNTIARNRHRLANPNACPLPSPEQQARFID